MSMTFLNSAQQSQPPIVETIDFELTGQQR